MSDQQRHGGSSSPSEEEPVRIDALPGGADHPLEHERPASDSAHRAPER